MMSPRISAWLDRLRAALPRSWFATSGVPHLILESLVALTLAFLVWLYARSRHQDSLDQVPIPVQIALAPALAGQYDIEVSGPSRVLVSFTGPASCMRELRDKLQSGGVRVNLTVSVPEDRQVDSVYRDTVCVEAAHIPVPPGVEPSLVEAPFCIPVTLHRLADRRLPVRLDYAGETRISQIKLEPATVMVRGPKDILDRATGIPTQPYFVPATSEGRSPNETMVRGEIALAHELEGRPIQITPETVTFHYRVQPRQKTYELRDVPVYFLSPPDCPWRPHFSSPLAGRVTVRVTSPSAEDFPSVLAFVDLTHGEFTQGRNREPIRLQLPRDAQLAQEPPVVMFYLDPVDAGAVSERGE
jgi:hypothetical protein